MIGYVQRRASHVPVLPVGGVPDVFLKNVEWDDAGMSKEEILKNFRSFEKIKNDARISAGFLIEFSGLMGRGWGRGSAREHANYIFKYG